MAQVIGSDALGSSLANLRGVVPISVYVDGRNRRLFSKVLYTVNYKSSDYIFPYC